LRHQSTPCGAVKIKCIGTADRPGRPVFSREQGDLGIVNEPPCQKRIEMAHASFIQIEHAPRPKGPDIIDFDNEPFAAALHECKGRLIKFAIADTAKAISQVGLYGSRPCGGIIEFTGGSFWPTFFPAVTKGVVG